MLAQFLVSELFGFLLVFCRLGTALMVMPGFGETYVSMRFRLMMALMFSMVVAPVITLPPVPNTIFGLVTLLSAEILIGLFLGGLTRMLISALHMGGMIIAYQSSMASALIPDVTQSQGAGQGSVLGNLLGIAALVLIFATDLHHLMLRGLADSYTLFFPGHFPIMEDFANKAAQIMNESFRLAMKLAAPHLVIGLTLYLGNGIIARLMPNIQIFFIMIPVQLSMSFFILMVVISAILMWYMEYFKDALGTFLTLG